MTTAAGGLAAACRPRQWIQNGLVFVPLISSASFGSRETTRRTAIAAGAFCLMASAVYLWNDVADLECDRAHPMKKSLPVTTGALDVRIAAAGLQSEHSQDLVITLPLFLYGVFRYLYLVYERGAGGSPEEIFLHDRPLQMDAVLYLAAAVVILTAKY